MESQKFEAMMDVLQDIHCKHLKKMLKLELELEFMQRNYQCIDGDIRSFAATMDILNDRLIVVEKKTSGDDDNKLECEIDDVRTNLQAFVDSSDKYRASVSQMFDDIIKMNESKQRSINIDTEESILSIVCSIDKLERDNARLMASLQQQQNVIDSLIVRLDALEPKDDWESLT